MLFNCLGVAETSSITPNNLLFFIIGVKMQLLIFCSNKTAANFSFSGIFANFSTLEIEMDSFSFRSLFKEHPKKALQHSISFLF